MTAENHKTGSESQIRALLDDWTNALRVKDSGGVLSHYVAEGPPSFISPPLKYAGAHALDEAGLETWFSSFHGPLGYEIHDLTITAGDDMGFCHSLNRLSGMKTDGDWMDIWLRTTVHLRKIDGKWKIAREHKSPPCCPEES
jgi:ketosteroid isomerase-like protein